MAWWNVLNPLIKSGKEVVEVFKPNEEKKSERRHEEVMADIDRDLASLQQFSAEFHDRKNRTWWDSFVDGLNRLPRPLLTIGIVSMFVLAPVDPERFLLIAKAYELMPDGYWMLLSIIVSFYFGGRMQIKAQDMSVKKNAVKAAQELVVMKKEFRKLEEKNESMESKTFDNAVQSGITKRENKVITEWLKKGKKFLK